MNDKENETIKDQLVIKAFEQNWLHGRHVETERFWMLQVYIIITVAFYTVKIADSFLKEIFNPTSNNLILLIIILFTIHIIYSIFNLLASIKLSAEYDRHNYLAIEILKRFNLNNLMQRPLQHSETGFSYFIFSNFVTFNRIISHIYMLFISVDTFIIMASLYPSNVLFNFTIAIVIYIILFIFTLKLKKKLEEK